MSIKLGKNTYYTAMDVAKLVGVSVQVVRRWDNLKLLRVKRHPFNNYRLYEVKEVELFVKKHKKYL